MKQHRKTPLQTPATQPAQAANSNLPEGLKLRRKLFVVQQPPRWTRDR